MTVSINEVDKIEVLTLQDNYIDLMSRDNTEVVLRAMPLKDMEVKNSILAEHGFSALVTVTTGEQARYLLFDFGYSKEGAAQNADALSVDLSGVEATALSHGHLDHVGGIEALIALTKKKGLPLVLHPAAFRNPRIYKVTEDFKVFFPSFTREKAAAAGVSVVESTEPYPLLDGDVLFLGEIPRETAFEKGMPNIFYEENGVEKPDDIIDDTSIVMNVRGKGLVIISGCAHSGIINTVNYAKKITGLESIYTVMGGFHLSGPDMEPAIEPTIAELKKINPTYVIPTHCTGRNAIMAVEESLPDQFILNMSGTKLTFAA
jgi:7,8-dihydropterin-6-yl-methyl-4-(beta-D-ribofuranosyl)aminobenzene 5'-phosphate synthase